MFKFDEESIALICNDLQKSFQTFSDIVKKKKKKIQIEKLPKYQKILKNQKIHYLEIIEIKQNIYVTAQQRNIRERCVIFKRIIYGYNG